MPSTAAALHASSSAERRLIARLEPALREAVDRGRPVHVEKLHTLLPHRTVIQLAARLCLHVEAKLAVLPTPSGRGVIFVPV
ncbi:MAG TPA: hypothetical protein VHC67_08770 [Gaiellaceae bacterium]|jgi:hypothetical protein|nr:hypothetical protein [Gaiellaceae bacterium]